MNSQWYISDGTFKIMIHGTHVEDCLGTGKGTEMKDLIERITEATQAGAIGWEEEEDGTYRAEVQMYKLTVNLYDTKIWAVVETSRGEDVAYARYDSSEPMNDGELAEDVLELSEAVKKYIEQKRASEAAARRLELCKLLDEMIEVVKKGNEYMNEKSKQ